MVRTSFAALMLTTWCIAPAFAQMTLLGVGGPKPLTFQGKSLREILEKVPCDLITRQGHDFKVNAILVVEKEKEKETLTDPLISDESQIKEIEQHCPQKH